MGSCRDSYGATAVGSYVRTRVARRDWCASRNVVSVTASAVWARSTATNPSGPGSRSRWRDPSWAGAFRSSTGSIIGRGPRLVRAVLGHVGEVATQSGAPVGTRPCREELGAFADETCREVTCDELRIGEDGLQERDVGPDPADAVAPSSRMPAHPGERYAMIRSESGRNPFEATPVVIRVCSATPLTRWTRD